LVGNVQDAIDIRRSLDFTGDDSDHPLASQATDEVAEVTKVVMAGSPSAAV
jgi:hypothetical protein